MKFIIQKHSEICNFSLIYRSEEYSFDTEPYYGFGFTSIMINDLQLEIDDEAIIRYVWGYCPLIQYEKTKECPRKYTRGTLIAVLDTPPVPGVSYRINEKERWPIYLNKQDGWVCIGDPKTQDKKLVEFAPNCIASMVHDEIAAVWLRPTSLPQI